MFHQVGWSVHVKLRIKHSGGCRVASLHKVLVQEDDSTSCEGKRHQHGGASRVKQAEPVTRRGYVGLS